MARSILSMVVGLLAVNAVVFAGVVALRALGLFADPPVAENFIQRAALAALSLAGGVMAGIAAGVVARRAPLAHAAAFGGVLFAIALGDTHRQWVDPKGQPHGFLITLLLAAPLGALVGGLIQQARAARTGSPESN
jgi:hypothetical protein